MQLLHRHLHFKRDHLHKLTQYKYTVLKRTVNSKKLCKLLHLFPLWIKVVIFTTYSHQLLTGIVGHYISCLKEEVDCFILLSLLFPEEDTPEGRNLFSVRSMGALSNGCSSVISFKLSNLSWVTVTTWDMDFQFTSWVELWNSLKVKMDSIRNMHQKEVKLQVLDVFW